MRVLLYWLFVFLLFAAGVLNSHIPLTAVYSPTAAILVFAGLPLLVLCRLGAGGTAQLAGRMLRQKLEEDDYKIFDLLNAASFLFSGIGVLVGMIHVFRNLANHDAIGPGIAIAFVCLIYGALVPVLLLPFLSAAGAKRLMKQAAVFAYLVAPGAIGVTMFTMNVIKIL